MTYSVLIVDDEPLARERIRSFLAEDEELKVCAECVDGLEAVAAIETYSPDLVFLDIQMPELTGFGVIDTIGVEKMPLTIFVTAYDQYAIQAFEAHALDYLLKPYDEERFQKTLRRAKEQLEKRNHDELHKQLSKLLSDVTPKTECIRRIVVKDAGKIFFVLVDEILWIDAAGNYLDLHTKDKTHCIRETMKKIESKLNPKQFVRIHRSTIVNLNHIQEMQAYLNNDFIIILTNGDKVVLSRNYRVKMEEALGKKL
jgi:two-component system, LytTR family, response regulator